MEREISIILKVRGAKAAKKAVQDVFNQQTTTLVEGFNKRTKKTSDNMERVTKTSKRASKSMDGFTKILGRGMAALYLYNRAWAVFGRNFESGLQLQRASEQFDRHVGSVVERLPELRAATRGVVADFELLKTANRAFQQGLRPQQMGRAFRLATSAAQKLGLQATDAINTITNALTKQDEGALNTLGVVTKVNQAYKTQAALIAKSGGVMSQAMAIQLRQALIVKELERRFGGVNKAQEDGLMILERFRASWKNFRATIGDTLGLALLPLTRALTGVLDATTSILNRLNKTEGFKKFVQIASTLAIVWGSSKFIGGAGALIRLFGVLGKGSVAQKALKVLGGGSKSLNKFKSGLVGVAMAFPRVTSFLGKFIGLGVKLVRVVPGVGTALALLSIVSDSVAKALGKAWIAGKVFFQLLSNYDERTGLSKVLKKDAEALGSFYNVVDLVVKGILYIGAAGKGVLDGISEGFAPLMKLFSLVGDGVSYVAEKVFGLARTGPLVTSKLEGITNWFRKAVKWVGLLASGIALLIPGFQAMGAVGVGTFGVSLAQEYGLMGDIAGMFGGRDQPQPTSAGLSAPALQPQASTQREAPTPRAMNMDYSDDLAEQVKKMNKLLEKQTGIMEEDSQKQDIRESQRNAHGSLILRR